MVQHHFIPESDPATLAGYLREILSIANAEKNALGFLPEGAYRDAIAQRRLIAMISNHDRNPEVAAFLLFGGVFPHARVQQVATRPKYRQSGVASALINALVSELECTGYLTIQARVASDLYAAQNFYEKNGFNAVREYAGGRARDRKIVVRVRELETDTLFDLVPTAGDAEPNRLDLGLRQRSASDNPIFVIDLNVLFDLVRDRQRSEDARRLFGAALAHRVRLVVAAEFIEELQRTSKTPTDDPILQMALRLPRLPQNDVAELDALSAQIHKIVFIDNMAAGANTEQAFSDARHLAHAALSRASGYVTSDRGLLTARKALHESVGIDVISPDDLMGLLPDQDVSWNQVRVRGHGFECRIPSATEFALYLSDVHVPPDVKREFTAIGYQPDSIERVAIYDQGSTVAAGILIPPTSIDAPARLLIHVRPYHVNCETFADYLIDKLTREACAQGPVTVELRHVPGQSTVSSLAKARGFLQTGLNRTLLKVALGCPLTGTNWSDIGQQLRRRTGLKLPDEPFSITRANGRMNVIGPNGITYNIAPKVLEELLGPAIIVWPGRRGVIQPIAREYADDLLGTSAQLSFLERSDASFLSRRAYVNSARAANVMLPDSPIFFYESQRSGGRGAIIAIGRIVDTLLFKKNQIPHELSQRLVVEGVDEFSASNDVLLTSFDNLLTFPRPCSLPQLRSFGAVGNQNLQTTTLVSNQNVGRILDFGWSNG